jgi:hypothetical protein
MGRTVRPNALHLPTIVTTSPTLQYKNPRVIREPKKEATKRPRDDEKQRERPEMTSNEIRRSDAVSEYLRRSQEQLPTNF